jgi:serine/threonine-protein kinase
MVTPLRQTVPQPSPSRYLHQQRKAQNVRTDRAFGLLMAVQWAVAVAVAAWWTPLTWTGAVASVHLHVWSAVGLGGLFTLPPLALIAWQPGRAATRHAVAVGQTLMSALLIHLTGGRIETHFHVFGSLAFLAVYRDWPVLLTAAAVVTLDHVVRGVLAPVSVFGVADTAPLIRTLEHAGWVLFEVAFLIVSMVREERMLRRVAAGVPGDIGPYHVVRLISSGGMGDVYLAEHQMLKRPCAVKVIRQDHVGDERAVARFEREVRAMSRLRHPNTVEVYDFGVAADGTFYYVMEYLDGQTLTELVRAEGAQPPARVAHLLRQVAGALGEAHRDGLVHRDINPNNVLVCRLGGTGDVVKLLDFGLVTSAAPEDQKLTSLGTFVGSPLYVSPEQARGTEVDARSDLYSLGAVAHFLLTGRPPFVHETTMDILFAHTHSAPPRPSDSVSGLAGAWDRLVLTCLAKAPGDRFADAAAFEAALDACSDGEVWNPRRSTPALRLVGWPPPNHRVVRQGG